MKDIKKEKHKHIKLFSVVINPKFDEVIDWKLMSYSEMENKLKQLKFPDRFLMTNILTEVRVQNVNKNYTEIENFIGQLETGTENLIPHYQLTIKVSALCTRKKVLETQWTTHRDL